LRVSVSVELADFMVMYSGFSSWAKVSAAFSQTGTCRCISHKQHKQQASMVTRQRGGATTANLQARVVEDLAVQVRILLQHFTQVDDHARLVALRWSVTKGGRGGDKL
jgi:hypothetical protein